MTKSSRNENGSYARLTRGRCVPRILTISSSADPHTEAVLKLCREAGAECQIVSEDSLLSLAFDSPRGSRQGHQEVLKNPPSAIWWRLKPGYFRVEELNSPNMFIRREWQHTLEAFEGLFGDARWVNPRCVDRFVRHKPNQLRHATNCGLLIPRTLISNDPERVAEFVASQPNRKCIFKPLSWFSEQPDLQLFTSIVDRSAVRSNPDGIRRAPGIYQEMIPKAYELRITVVQQQIFPIRIDSQSNPDTKLDWRRNQLNVPYSIEKKLPRRLTDALLRFHSSTGLVYGAYDFIVTPDKKYVFLEVNPVGQWLWLEEATGSQISAAMATYLLSPQLTPPSRNQYS